MARGSIKGVGLATSTIRFQPAVRLSENPFCSPVRRFPRILSREFPRLLGLLLIALCAALPVNAQSDQDVHVVPREQKKDAKPDPTVMPSDVAAAAKEAGVSVDPTLKTHTKPIRKDVDLVLVPVTITDPMNRLVTGLEKENFALTDNGQPQEIRHFSSEDAP